MAELADLAVLYASNTARFPEWQSIPSLNDAGRALEGLLARGYRDRSGYTLSSGTGSAYAILTNASYTAHAAGMVFLFRANVVCNAAPTLTVNSLTAKTLKRQGGSAIQAGDIASSQQVLTAYNTALDCYECIGIGDGAPVAPSYTVPAFRLVRRGELRSRPMAGKTAKGRALVLVCLCSMILLHGVLAIPDRQ